MSNKRATTSKVSRTPAAKRVKTVSKDEKDELSNAAGALRHALNKWETNKVLGTPTAATTAATDDEMSSVDDTFLSHALDEWETSKAPVAEDKAVIKQLWSDAGSSVAETQMSADADLPSAIPSVDETQEPAARPQQLKMEPYTAAPSARREFFFKFHVFFFNFTFLTNHKFFFNFTFFKNHIFFEISHF